MSVHVQSQTYIGSRLFFRDLLSLGKSGVMTLLLVSTVSAMVIASNGQVRLSLVFFTVLGGILLAGSAGALNCIWDKDLDALMERTKLRPLPSGRLPEISVLILACSAAALGFAVLYAFSGLGAAWIGLGGHLFYVFVYTVWLKRRTPLNIVVGGLCGGAPLLAGWTAAAQLELGAWLLFLVVVLWTPPHFWALALLRQEEYAKAGVPMLPVVYGEKRTVDEMLFYSLLLVPAAVLAALVCTNLSVLSLAAAFFLSLGFVREIAALRAALPETAAMRRRARRVFSYSVFYLALLFSVFVADVLIGV